MEFPDGYESWDGTDPFEDMAGPLKFRRQEDGQYTTAFISQPQHCNGGGMIHGGMLMTFADFSLFCIAKDALDDHFGVTVSFNSEFIAAVGAGHLVESEGTVTRATRSGLIFITGRIFSGDTVLMTYSGIIKKIAPRG